MDVGAPARAASLVWAAAGARAARSTGSTKLWAERTLADEPDRRDPRGAHAAVHDEPGRRVLSLDVGARGSSSRRRPSVCVVVGVVAFRDRPTLQSVALGLILGGALGNLLDRITRGPGFSGEVVDFIDLHIWPVFNLADAAVVIGALSCWSASSFREGRAARGRRAHRCLSASRRRRAGSTSWWPRSTGAPRADVQRAIDGGPGHGRRRPRGPRPTGSPGASALDVDLAVAEEPPAEPEGAAVPVRYRDEHLVVVAKPAGIDRRTRPRPRPAGTLVNRLLGHGDRRSPRRGDAAARDRASSGRRHERAARRRARPTRPTPRCGRMFRRHEVDRRYLALVRGDAGARPVHGRRAARPSRGADRRRPGRGARGHDRVRGDASGSRVAALLEAAPRDRDAPTRSGCTSPRSATRSWATARYGGGGELARALGLDRPFLHAGGWPSTTRSPARASTWRSRCRPTSSTRSRAPGATCDLDASDGPGVPSESPE